jgi:hypothetical protein
MGIDEQDFMRNPQQKGDTGRHLACRSRNHASDAHVMSISIA